MEPGREDREHVEIAQEMADELVQPQWNPVAKTGSTHNFCNCTISCGKPQWNPVAKTGSTLDEIGERVDIALASMEPGREDREHAPPCGPMPYPLMLPQWNPVAKTGSTKHRA